MAKTEFTPMEVSEEFNKELDNTFMVFWFDSDEISKFVMVMTAKSFWTFIGSNNVGLLKEEELTFPTHFLNGTTRKALVHYVDGKKFAAYVPAFPTQEDMDKYDKALGR